VNPHRRFILEKMLRHGWIGGKHTAYDNIRKGKPVSEYKAIEKELKQLIREGFVISKPTGYGTQVSLNPRRVKEIIEMIEKEEWKK